MMKVILNAVVFAGTVAMATTVSGGTVTIAIDGAIRHQTMEGFGATHLSLIYEGDGDVLGPVLRAQAVDAVYNQVRLTTGNVAGALLETPAGWDERTNDDLDPFNFNWGGFSTFAADNIKQFVVDLAQPVFDNYYIETKITVRWASPWLAQIRHDDYDRYLDECAEQVLASQIYWRDTFGVVPRYNMLFNEPLSGNVELWPGSYQEVVDIIKRTGPRLRSEGFADIMFVVPGEETEQGSLDLSTAILADADARQYVGAIAFHPYPFGSMYSGINNILSTSGTGNPDPEKVAVRNQLRDLCSPYGIPVWMTEVSNGGVDPRSFDDLRGRAIHIHDEFIYADAAAYFGMNNMWDRLSQQSHFGNNDLYGNSSEGTVVLIDQDIQEVIITGMGYAIGHYARWFNRGAVRVEAVSDDPLLQVTAFEDESQRRVVLVVINNAATATQLDVTLAGLTLLGNVEGEQSTATAPWQPLTPFTSSTSTSFTTTVPPRSVTTFAASLAGVPGDLDGDGDVDLTDLGLFVPCLTGPEAGPAAPGCGAGDFDLDSDVDLADFAAFQLAFTGSA